MKKFGKICVIIAASVFCFVYGTFNVSAEESEETVSVSSYAEAVRIAGISYDPSFAELIVKIAEENRGERIYYENSLTKNFADKLLLKYAAMEKNAADKGLFFAEATDKIVRIHGARGKKVINAYADEKEGTVLYLDKRTLVSADTVKCEKSTLNIDSKQYDELFSRLSFTANLDLYKLHKGKSYHFKYRGKSYVSEIFESYGGKIGLVFDSENSPCGLYNSNTGYMSVRLSFSPSDDLFGAPPHYPETVTAYSETVKLSGTVYDSVFAEKITELAGRDSDKKISYKNSRTKRFLGKISERLDSIENGSEKETGSGYYFSSVGKDKAVIFGRKGEKALYVYADGENSVGICLDKKTYIKFYPKSGVKETTDIGEEEYSAYLKFLSVKTNSKIPDSLQADVWKLSYKGEKYTLELFDANGVKEGYLFDGRGAVIGEYHSEQGYMSVRYLFSPKNSRFSVSEYKEAEN